MLVILAALALHQAAVTLPEAMPMPSADVDQSAIILAQKVARHEPDAGPALMAALKGCGFYVLGPDRKPMQAPLNDKGMGLAIEGYEVLDCLNNDENAMKFGGISSAMGYLVGPNMEDQFHKDLIADLQLGMSSKNPEIRFFCHFFDALSQYGRGGWSVFSPLPNGGLDTLPALKGTAGDFTPSNPLAPQTAQDAAFALQMAISQEMASQMSTNPAAMGAFAGAMQSSADLMQYAMQKKNEATTDVQGNPMTADMRPYADNPISILQAILLSRRLYGDMYSFLASKPHDPASAVQGRNGPFVLRVDQDEAPKDWSGTIMDAGAVGISNFMNWGVYSRAASENYGEMTEKATLAAAYTKLLCVYSALEITLKPSPLEFTRRKDKLPGPATNLTCSIKLNVEKLVSRLSEQGGNGYHWTTGKVGSLNNVVRPISWFLGMDIGLPDDGGVRGAEETWEIWEKPENLDYSVQWVDPKGAGSNTIKLVGKTDENGEMKQSIQTTPQRVELPDDAQGYVRWAQVVVSTRLKGNDLAQDLVDASNIVMTGVMHEGTPMSKLAVSALAAIPEMLYRSPIIPKSFNVKVHDWKMPAWEGSFKATLTSNGNDGSGTQWSITRTAKGRLVCIDQLSETDAIAKAGVGGYMFHVDQLGDEEVHDSYKTSIDEAVGCIAPGDTQTHGIPYNETYQAQGPEVGIQQPYSMEGGMFTMVEIGDPEHGQSKRKVLVGLCIQVPVKFTLSKTGGSEHEFEFIQGYGLAPIVGDFDAVYPGVVGGSKLSATFEKDLQIPFVSGSQKAHVTLEWELHRVPKP